MSTNALWNKNVKLAKQYVKVYDNTRWIIAQLAIEVCDLSKGGRKSEDKYSIKNFANEIGIDPKTLYQWISVKRNVIDKLPDRITKRLHKYNYQDLVVINSKVESNAVEKDIVKVFDDSDKESPVQRKFNKYYKHLSSILFNVKKQNILNDLPNIDIDNFIKRCDVISDLLKSERMKRSTLKQINKPKRPEIKNILKERLNSSRKQ